MSRPTSRGAVSFEYKVIPFSGRVRGRLSGEDVATQLQVAIGDHAREGWEFHMLVDVNVEVQPGCLAGLFGATTHYAKLDQMIFRREYGHQSPSIEEAIEISPSLEAPPFVESGHVEVHSRSMMPEHPA